MKLSPIKMTDFLAAANEIDVSGIKYPSSYWVVIPEKDNEYPFKQLVRKAYTIATGITEDNDLFQSSPYYRNYIKDTFGYHVKFRMRDNIPFFNPVDLEFFEQHAGKTYNSADPLSMFVGQRLKREIFAKTSAWAQALDIDGFEVKTDNAWQRRGTFSSYSWARIFKRKDNGRKVFFTVGVDPDEQALVYKLDRYYSSAVEGNSLKPEQDLIFNRIVQDTSARWQGIYINDLDQYNWEMLIETTRKFIDYYTPLYDEAVAAVWDPFDIAGQPGPKLRQQPLPTGIKGLKRANQVQFESNADYDNENAHKKQLGDNGENLVIAEEKRLLIEAGRADLADKVKKVLDWNGYDISSFQPDGSPKFIEVKTTSGSATRPFFWTSNERATMLANKNYYYLYRLYNFDSDNDTADFFILQGDFSDQIIEEPTCYSVCVLPRNG